MSPVTAPGRLPVGSDTIESLLAGLGAGPRTSARQRLTALASALGDVTADRGDLVAALERRLSAATTAELWLARAVLGASLPDPLEMEDLLRTFRLYGAWSALLPALQSVAMQHPQTRVRVVTGAVTCDIHHTASTDYVSGIQRVVRNTVTRWSANHAIEFIGWTGDLRAFRPVPSTDFRRIFGDAGPIHPEHEVVVPWRGIHLVPELAAEPDRSSRLSALGKYSGVRIGAIGYDCIPMTTPSSVTPGMVSVFARYLSATGHMHRVAAISAAAAEEYEGWRQMVQSRNLPGPEISEVALPVSAVLPTESALAQARDVLGMTVAPMVFVVGSHEPRKNHLAILHAAELLWRDGLQFTLTIVGAGSWQAEDYHAAVDELTRKGRPVRSIRGLPDELLWAGYHLAHFSLFPSLNEGFGLPVAESLAAGTPVVTSDFGSTREIVAPDGVPLGGLLVDPRDDHSIAAAMRTMLTDPVTYRRLKDEVALHRLGTWDEYARDVWEALVGNSGSDAEVPIESPEVSR